jgi:hypothetical protein
MGKELERLSWTAPFCSMGSWLRQKRHGSWSWRAESTAKMASLLIYLVSSGSLSSFSMFGTFPYGLELSEHVRLKVTALLTWQLVNCHVREKAEAARALKSLSLEWVQHHFCCILLIK